MRMVVAGTREPRRYDATIDCVLKSPLLLRDGYDLFLTSNGVVLISDDFDLYYFKIVGTYPNLSNNILNPSVGQRPSSRSSIGSMEK